MREDAAAPPPPTMTYANANEPHSSLRLLGNNDTSLSAGMPSTGWQSEGFFLSIFCFVIMIPCILAACAQSIYCVKKRRQDRIERLLLAVSTDPTSRMLVLSEIFKDDGRTVTEDEAYAKKKKRVLVKKHRKRTPSERQGKSTDVLITSLTDEAFNLDDNTERVERYRESSNECDIEDQMTETWWDENEGNISDDEKPTIVYISENVEHNDIAYEQQLLELDNVSTFDGEENDEIGCEHKITRHNADLVRGSANFNIEGQFIDIQPGVHCGEGEVKDVDDRMIDDATCNTDTMVPSTTTALIHDLEEEITTKSDIMHVSDDSLDSSVLVKEGTKKEVSPGLSTPDNPSKSENEFNSGTYPKSPPDVTLEPNNPPGIPSLSAAETPSHNYLSPRALSPHPSFVDITTEPVISGLRSMPDLSDDDSDDGDAPRTKIRSLFRGTNHDDNIPEVRACGSDVTEVTSNVEGKENGVSAVEPLRATPAEGADLSGPSRYCQLNAANSLGEEGAIPMEKVESFNSTDLSSTISYFSYEDISIASEESEMCAICLCAYEEGDVRIFSKRCSHAFHKECILEWLVKSQQCPCCRIDMVTKSEIKQISASLIGTEQLAQAMAVVNGSEMQEGAPFRVQRQRLARQLRSIARAQRRRSGPDGQLSPFPPRLPTMRHFNNGNNLSTSPSMPRTNNANTHNRDWVWTTRFIDDEQTRTINPSRSSDAIMNPHETNQMNTMSTPGLPTAGGGTSMHNSSAGSLFSTNGTIVHANWMQPRDAPHTNGSIFHDHWLQQRQVSPTRRGSSSGDNVLAFGRLGSIASTTHAHWRQQMPTNSESPLPVLTLPAI